MHSDECGESGADDLFHETHQLDVWKRFENFCFLAGGEAMEGVSSIAGPVPAYLSGQAKTRTGQNDTGDSVRINVM